MENAVSFVGCLLPSNVDELQVVIGPDSLATQLITCLPPVQWDRLPIIADPSRPRRWREIENDFWAGLAVMRANALHCEIVIERERVAVDGSAISTLRTSKMIARSNTTPLHRTGSVGRQLHGGDSVREPVVGESGVRPAEFYLLELQHEWTGSATSNEELCGLEGVRVDTTTGDLYVADVLNSRVLAYLDPLAGGGGGEPGTSGHAGDTTADYVFG
jgi:hypothetical protein